MFDATYELTGTGSGTETYRVTVTANTAGYSGAAGDYITSLAIKIANSVSSFSLVSGPANSTLGAGGVDASGCSGNGGGFVCDAFTPILLPDGTLTLVLSETIGTGDLLTGNLEASLKAEYCNVGTGIESTGKGCPGSHSRGITSRGITLTALTAVPEPSTIFLSGTALIILGYIARKNSRGGQRATAI